MAGQHPDTPLAAALAERNRAGDAIDAFNDGALPLAVLRGHQTIDEAERALHWAYERACAAVNSLVRGN